MKRLFLFTACLVLIFMLFVEMSYRYFYNRASTAHNDLNAYNLPDYYFPAPYVGFKGRPYASTGFMTDDNGPIRFNSLGYRGELPPRQKDSSEFRLFVLGASAVFGDQVDFPTRLEEHLHEIGYKNVQVYNFAAVSSGIGQDLARLVFELVDLKPDLVIMYGGASDLEHPLSHDPRPGYPYNFMLVENNPLIQRDLDRYEALPLLLFKSSYLRQRYKNYFLHKFARIEELRQEVDFGTQNWYQKIIDRYWETHQKANTIANSFGAHYLGVYQPMIFYKTRLLGAENIHIHHAKKDLFLRYRQMLRQKELDFPFLDMSGAFNHIEGEVFKDERHVYDQYQTEIAKTLTRDVIQRGFLDKKIQATN